MLVGVLGLSLSGSATATKIGPLGFSVGALKAPNADLNGDKVFDDLAAKLDTMGDDETLSVIVRMKGDLITRGRGRAGGGGFDYLLAPAR